MYEIRHCKAAECGVGCRRVAVLLQNVKRCRYRNWRLIVLAQVQHTGDRTDIEVLSARCYARTFLLWCNEWRYGD